MQQQFNLIEISAIQSGPKTLNLSKYLRILENTDLWSSIKLIEILAIGLKNFNNIEMMNIPEFRNSPQGTFMLKSRKALGSKVVITIFTNIRTLNSYMSNQLLQH